MSSYHIYKQTRDAAWRFLIDNNITSLPLSFSDICRANNIKLLRYIGNDYFADDERGITFIKDGQYNIIVNGADSLQVQRYTMGHELGHIFLGHLQNGQMHTRISGTRSDPKAPMEYQAERFAMGILAPACVLWGLDLHSPKDIAKVCYISIEDARYRADRMRDLYKRDVFLASELEKRVFEQFKSFVETKKAPLAGA